MFLDPLAHAVNGQFEHIRIGEAPLDITLHPLSLDEWKIFRMLLVQLLGNEIVQAMHEGKINHRGPAVLLGQVAIWAVDSVARGKIRIVHHLAPIHFPVFQGRNLLHFELGQSKAICARHRLNIRRKPPHA